MNSWSGYFFYSKAHLSGVAQKMRLDLAERDGNAAFGQLYLLLGQLSSQLSMEQIMDQDQ